MILQQPWGYWKSAPNGKEKMAAELSNEHCTGACISLDPSDAVPLLILDFDLDKATFDEKAIWEILSGGLPWPDSLGVTRTISNGYHFWFSLPGETKDTRLPDTFDFGQGLSGEIRVSSRPNTLLMLPGSVAINKQKQPKTYQNVQFPDSPEELLEVPRSLLTRLVARPDSKTAEEGRIPTEAAHLLDLLELIIEIPDGEQNVKLSQIGQMVGRMVPHSDPSKLLESFWDKVAPKVGTDWKPTEFAKAFASGFRKGKTNANKFAKREKNPTLTEIDAETQAIFGGKLWMHRLIDSDSKTAGFIIGVGGSHKRPHEAVISIQLDKLDIDDLLPQLASAAKVPGDTVVTSPLFVQGGWRKALEFALKKRCQIEPLGLPPEDLFIEKLNHWCSHACGDGRLIERWSEKREWDKGAPFIIHPADGQDICFVLPERAYERLLRQSGDISVAMRIAKKFLIKKNLTGRGKAWIIGIESLDEGTTQSIRLAYEKMIETRMKK